MSVGTCHSYQIHQPFKYRCTNSVCMQEYGRHSKSIDVEAKVGGNGAAATNHVQILNPKP
jgi:hypothetical protein